MAILRQSRNSPDSFISRTHFKLSANEDEETVQLSAVYDRYDLRQSKTTFAGRVKFIIVHLCVDSGQNSEHRGRHGK